MPYETWTSNGNRSMQGTTHSLRRNELQLTVYSASARSWERNIPEHIEPYTLTNIVVNPPAGWKGADASTQSLVQQKLKTFHEKRAASKAPLSQQMETQYMALMKQEIKRVLKEADVLIMTTSQTGLKQIRDIPTSMQILDERPFARDRGRAKKKLQQRFQGAERRSKWGD